MKNLIFAVIALVCLAPAARAAGCGDPQRVAFLFHEAVYSQDRTGAESRLIGGILPVSACLSREGYKLAELTIPGRLGIILVIQGALRRQSVRMNTPEDVDRLLRFWKVNAPKR